MLIKFTEYLGELPNYADEHSKDIFLIGLNTDGYTVRYYIYQPNMRYRDLTYTNPRYLYQGIEPRFIEKFNDMGVEIC